MTPANRRGWTIVALLFCATAINYIDRQTLSVLGPTLRLEFNLSEHGYANVVTAFLIPYTIMYSLGGRLMDRFGARLGLAVSLAWWSIATMLTGFARGALTLGVFRCLLGVAEPCVFPAGIKACTEWFPSARRALATGIFSSGSAVGAILAPPVVAWCTLAVGWRFAFLIPGALGLIWLPCWLVAYRKSGPVDPAARTVAVPTWRQLLKDRTVWGLVLPRFAADPVWYFYLFWLPDYLQRARGLSLRDLAVYGWIPFLFADLGSLVSGAVSDRLIRHGWTPARARMAVLIAVGCLSPFGALAGRVSSASFAIAITCLVAFLTQCWSTNSTTLASDLLPAPAVGTAAGMMGTAGSLGGALFAQVLALVIARFGYPAAFAVAAVLHPLAAITTLLLLRRPLLLKVRTFAGREELCE
jgi:ACS family hexuronate transporter-like MFS transporter